MFGRGKNTERSGTPADLLVVGLGNPGEKYEGTRHNVGAEVVQLLAERHGARLKATKQAALVSELRIGDQMLVVAFPQTFMNDSGRSAHLSHRRTGI